MKIRNANHYSAADVFDLFSEQILIWGYQDGRFGKKGAGGSRAAESEGGLMEGRSRYARRPETLPGLTELARFDQ
jgi:hypothetical protein